ncbi:hypothetical protein HDV02_002437 [Globomyces sp. JEL0801]|nr:hypothetical protein HDV02_002437 [Globomyces sp. JEL0801]
MTPHTLIAGDDENRVEFINDNSVLTTILLISTELDKRNWIESSTLTAFSNVFPEIGTQRQTASTVSSSHGSSMPPPVLMPKPTSPITSRKSINKPGLPSRDPPTTARRDQPAFKPSLPGRPGESESLPRYTAQPPTPAKPPVASKPQIGVPINSFAKDTPYANYIPPDTTVSVDRDVAFSVAKKAATSGAASQFFAGVKPSRGADGSIGFSVDPKAASQAAKTLHSTGATSELASGMSVSTQGKAPVRLPGYGSTNKDSESTSHSESRGGGILSGLGSPPPRGIKVPPGLPPPITRPSKNTVTAIKNFEASEADDLGFRVGDKITVIGNDKNLSMLTTNPTDATNLTTENDTYSTKILLSDNLPSEDEADQDFTVEDINEDISEDDLDDNIPIDEVTDIAIEALRLQKQKLRNGKEFNEYRDQAFINQTFESDEEDVDYNEFEEGDDTVSISSDEDEIDEKEIHDIIGETAKQISMRLALESNDIIDDDLVGQ